jgi:TRAP transporter TAXI family solute receptor
MFSRIKALLAVIISVSFIAVPMLAHAQSSQQAKRNIGIMAGPIGTTTARMAEDLSRTMSGNSGMQIRAMLGQGSGQNINDLLYLRGVDLAFVNADVLANIKITKPNHSAIGNLAYITKVTDSELHLIVRKDSGINDIYDLASKTVSIGNKGSGSALTSRLVLRLLGIDVTGVFMYPVNGLDALKKGELDAAFFVGAKPLPLLLNINEDDALKMISIPFSDQLAGIYNEAAFLSEDYPAIVEEKFVTTISVPVVLAVYNRFAKGSSRYNNLKIFSDLLLESIPLLQQPPRHPKWKELDLNATVDGWRRFSYLDNVLSQ